MRGMQRRLLAIDQTDLAGSRDGSVARRLSSLRKYLSCPLLCVCSVHSDERVAEVQQNVEIVPWLSRSRFRSTSGDLQASSYGRQNGLEVTEQVCVGLEPALPAVLRRHIAQRRAIGTGRMRDADRHSGAT